MSESIFVSKNGKSRMEVMNNEFTMIFRDGSSVSFPFSSINEFISWLDEENELTNKLLKEKNDNIKLINELEEKLKSEKVNSKELLHQIAEMTKDNSKSRKEYNDLKNDYRELSLKVYKKEQEVERLEDDLQSEIKKLMNMSFVERLKFAFTGEL